MMNIVKFIKKFIKVFIPYGILAIRNYFKTRFQPNLNRLKQRKLLRFDVHITDHCNLNCAGCEHFSPLSEIKYLDIKTYEKDCIRLNKLTNGIIDDIALLGGEPLLNPYIIDFMKITRKYFPICERVGGGGVIRIITNGTLLVQQPEMFWEACKENNIEIYISVYPVKVNYFYIKEKTDKYGIKLTFWGNPIEQSKDWRKCRIDITGRQNPWISNFFCYASNGCFQLANGKIYKCWRIAYIHYFNKAFDEDLKVSENDYIDIYKIDNIEELLKKIRKPVPFCRYCDMLHYNAVEWQRSKKEKNEWV
jgi:MoaA/NifB/PqqE/SkfB family radical SAM enzyme